MIISHRHRLVFYKPLKVGGSSIEVALSSHCGDKDILTGTAYKEEIISSDFSYPSQNNFHILNENEEVVTVEPIFSSHTSPSELQQAYEDFENIKNYFKFSIVRNPWSALVSYFWWTFYGYTALGEFNDRNIREHIQPMSYDTATVLRIKFQMFCEASLVFGEDEPGLVKPGDKIIEWFSRFQQDFFLSDDISYHIRFNNLQSDFDNVCDKVGLQTCALHRLKSKIKKSDLPYQQYYNAYTRDLVGDYFKETIERFDYKF